ncbi:long-chain fatty acid transport protein [Vibrio ishigakensis]|uniref:Long-chain fatty acid transport protein n=1 Tax=Vibrio ishigakensis TaxID=1481914 RepID=A0A0B8PMW4_9VIBR|nr:long-chain fatty acid transport protein [Vibrio ishigakensis]
MDLKSRNTALSLAITMAFSTPAVHSAGFQLTEHSAAGLGRANAGEAAIADGSSVMAHNAAAITRFDSYELSLGAAYVDAEVKATGNTTDASFNNQLTNNDVVDDVIIPHFIWQVLSMNPGHGVWLCLPTLAFQQSIRLTI